MRSQMPIMGSQGVSKGIHYLDDFLLFGKPGLGECADALHTALETCRTLGAPQGPSTVLTFLGICLDTRSPAARGQVAKATGMYSLMGRQERVQDLLSLLGLLHHAANLQGGLS